MSGSNAALFYIKTHNEVDQISPILYKLGQRGNITVDVVLEGDVSSSDYRIQAVNKYENIKIIDRKPANPQGSARDRAVELVKDFGRELPTDLPKRIYQRFVRSQNRLRIPDEVCDTDYEIIAFDWSHAKSERTAHLGKRDDVTTIVLPHGDSPFRNPMREENSFQEIVKNEKLFRCKHNLFEEVFQVYRQMEDFDYILMPNKLTAERVKNIIQDDKIKILGSPRYNTEWLTQLLQANYTEYPKSNEKLNVVLYTRRDGFFISRNEVINTIRLLINYPSVEVVVKEHPRGPLIAGLQEIQELSNVKIITDEFESVALNEWGDVFLTLGTTITFEPIMKGKPVLSLEYAHANHSTVASYLSASDMRCKDDLYYALHNLIENGSSDFYDKGERTQFIEEMITNSNEPVLESYAEFIESCLES